MDSDKHLVLEQVIIAAIDCHRFPLAEKYIRQLRNEFPGSLRVQKLMVMELEALEKYDQALDGLESLISQDETNAAARKRKVAVLKARGRTAEAIKELSEYTKKSVETRAPVIKIKSN